MNKTGDGRVEFLLVGHVEPGLGSVVARLRRPAPSQPHRWAASTKAEPGIAQGGGAAPGTDPG
jgi:hypothetical protein